MFIYYKTKKTGKNAFESKFSGFPEKRKSRRGYLPGLRK